MLAFAAIFREAEPAERLRKVLLMWIFFPSDPRCRARFYVHVEDSGFLGGSTCYSDFQIKR